jgi:hypothetical protein
MRQLRTYGSAGGLGEQSPRPTRPNAKAYPTPLPQKPPFPPFVQRGKPW